MAHIHENNFLYSELWSCENLRNLFCSLHTLAASLGRSKGIRWRILGGSWVSTWFLSLRIIISLRRWCNSSKWEAPRQSHCRLAPKNLHKKNPQAFYLHFCWIDPPHFTTILRHYHCNETFSVLNVCVYERFNYEYFMFSAAYTNDWQELVGTLSSGRAFFLGRLICTQRPLCESLSFHFSTVDLIRTGEQNSSQMFWTPLIFMTTHILALH